jgi:hypothetical protein
MELHRERGREREEKKKKRGLRMDKSPAPVVQKHVKL